MKLIRILSKSVSVLLLVGMVLSLLASCKGEESKSGAFTLEGFKIIRASREEDAAAIYTAKLKSVVEAKTGASLTVTTDDSGDSGEKEILIGQTNREASAEGLQYLKTKTDKDAYLIRISEKSIVILGTTEMATVRAIKIFIEKYVNSSTKGAFDLSAGNEIAGIYRSGNIISTENGFELESEIISNVYEMPKTGYDSTSFDSVFSIGNLSYPSIIKLEHQTNEKDNGKLIATFYLDATPVGGARTNTNACIMVSDNDGKSWKHLARPEESMDLTLKAGQMAHIYELPAKVGDMPAGTLIYSANSVDFARKTTISLWRSFDCGKTWEQYVCIAEGGGDREGVWEPFTLYNESDGYLYCFYSDDTGSKTAGDHDQTIVYKRSKDGIKWSEKVEVVACPDSTWRAGMPIITKMGNGEYFLVFELVHKFRGDWRSPIFFKTTSDLANWGDPSDYGKIIETTEQYYIQSAPACAWVDDGSPCGTLIVTARYDSKETLEQNKFFISLDYGKTWQVIDDPIPYEMININDGDRIGYSPAFWVGDNGKTLYYVNCVNASYDKEKRKIAFAKIKIYA